MLHFDVTLTADEARRALGLGTFGHRPRAFPLLGLLVTGVLLVSAEPWRATASPTTNGLLLVVAAAVMSVGLLPLLPLPWRSTLVRRRAPAAFVPHRVHVAAGYLAVEESGIERRFGWASVQRVRIKRDLLSIDVSDRRVVLPTRLFRSSAQHTLVLRRLRCGPAAAKERARLRRRRTDPFAPPRRS